MNTHSRLPPLSIGKYLTDIRTPFEGDLLDRKKLADKLTGYIDRLAAGAVIAIDAPWGEGKTWFGKNWARQLENDHRVLYLDAFAGDYMDDPFLLISAEIARLLEKDSQSGFKQKTVQAMKLLLPIGKTIINVAAHHLTGITDISGKCADLADALQTTISDSAEKLIRTKIDEYIAEQSSLKAFRDQLAQIAADKEKPIVFFIDELDRCSPAFAVSLLERLKHFFEIPNLVFVLLIHRNQLHEAIRGVYGQNTDASTYLHKFIHLFLTLPVRKNSFENEIRSIRRFMVNLLERHKIARPQNEYSLFIRDFSLWSLVAALSLRDIEKGTVLYFLSRDWARSYPNEICFLIVLKLKKPEWIERLLMKDETLYNDMETTYLNNMANIHTDEAMNLSKELRFVLSKILLEKKGNSFGIMKSLANELDLSVE